MSGAGDASVTLLVDVVDTATELTAAGSVAVEVASTVTSIVSKTVV